MKPAASKTEPSPLTQLPKAGFGGSLRKIIVLSALSAVATMGSAKPTPVATTTLAEPIRVTCVGDSITAGVGASKHNSYPDQLSRMLGKKWVVMNCGVSGATLLNHGDLPYQKQDLFKKALESRPDVVVIKLGTNDTKTQNWKFHSEFIADYEDLIRQFATLPEKPRIYICRPAFVPGQGNFGITEAVLLEEFPLLDKIAADEHVDIIDIHDAIKDHPELLPDRVHPNDQGATVLARTVYQALTGKEYTGASPLMTATKPQ